MAVGTIGDVFTVIRRRMTDKRRQKTGGRRQNTGDRSQEIGDRRQEAEVSRQETEFRDRRQKAGGQEAGDRSQETDKRLDIYPCSNLLTSSSSLISCAVSPYPRSLAKIR